MMHTITFTRVVKGVVDRRHITDLQRRHSVNLQSSALSMFASSILVQVRKLRLSTARVVKLQFTPRYFHDLEHSKFSSIDQSAR